MSTKNIPGAEDARKHFGQLASQVRNRVREIGRNIDGLGREVENIEIGARLAKQAVQDDREVLEEEREQLKGVLNGPPVEKPPAPTPVPPAPAAAQAPPEQPKPEAAAPAPQPAPASQPAQRSSMARHLMWALLLAAAFGILAFWLSSRNVETIARFASGDGQFSRNDIFQFLVVAVATLSGIFLGGYIGSKIDESGDDS